jgi:D-alanine-D-alanine ligase
MAMSAPKLRVGVIFGGRSGEHEVSLVSAGSVLQALDPAKYDVVPIGITRAGRWISSPHAMAMLKERTGLETAPGCVLMPEPGHEGLLLLSEAKPSVGSLDVIIPLVHGTYGEDGTLQGLLELADIPYVGAGVLGSALGMDKIVQKQLFIRAGLRIAKYTWHLSALCQQEPGKVARDVEKTLRYPIFVKPANTGSSVGITKAHTRAELQKGMADASTYDRKVIFEQGVADAREIECSVLGNDAPLASVCGEVIPSNEFYDYDAKYVDGASRAEIPARLPRRMSDQIRKMAVRAYVAIDCAGMARADFFVTRRKGTVYINELNTIPGFTSISMYPKLWEASGLSFPALLDRLIELAIQRHAEKARLRYSFDPSSEWYRS